MAHMELGSLPSLRPGPGPQRLFDFRGVQGVGISGVCG